MANQNHAENREMLLTLLADHNQVLKIVERHLAGETIAREVIEEGEKVSLMNISICVFQSCAVRNCRSSGRS
jgi:hypothetical protein